MATAFLLRDAKPDRGPRTTCRVGWSRRRKKAGDGRCGKTSEAQPVSVRPNPFEDAVGVADRETRRTRHWWPSISAPGTKTVAKLRSRQAYPRPPTARPVHRPCVDTGASRFHLLRSADIGRPETTTRWSNETFLANGRSKISGALPARGVSMPPSWSCRRHCEQASPLASPARAGLHHRRDRQPPLFALAIEAEWRKRALRVVPAKPKARPVGQRLDFYFILKRANSRIFSM